MLRIRQMSFKTTIEYFLFEFDKCGPLLSFSGRPKNVDHFRSSQKYEANLTGFEVGNFDV